MRSSSGSSCVLLKISFFWQGEVLRSKIEEISEKNVVRTSIVARVFPFFVVSKILVRYLVLLILQ